MSTQLLYDATVFLTMMAASSFETKMEMMLCQKRNCFAEAVVVLSQSRAVHACAMILADPLECGVTFLNSIRSAALMVSDRSNPTFVMIEQCLSFQV
jgi:hypothetical protein